MKITSSKFPDAAELLSLLLALALVLCIAIFSYRARAALGRKSDELAITQEIVSATNALLSTLKDAESGQRGYLLTDQDRYLEPYRQAIGNVPEELDRIAKATSSRPDQRERSKRLEALVQRKLAELKETLDLRRTSGPGAAIASVLTDRGKKEMDQIRQVCAEITTVANDRLSQQAEEARSGANEIGLISILGSIGLFVLLFLSAVTIYRGALRRQQLIEALREEEERTRRARDWLQTTLDSIGDAVIATDKNGRITFLNGVAQGLTGWSQKEAVGQPLEQIFVITNEETGATVENPVNRALREGRVIGLANHTLLTSREGAVTPIDDSAAPIRNAAGEVIGVVLVFRDIAQRKQAETALRDSERQFRELADSMPQIVWTARPDGFLDYYNQRWYDFTGFERGQGGDESWEPILHPDDVQRCVKTWYASVQSGEPYEIEYRFWDRRNYCWRWHLGRALPVRDSGNRVVKWFGTCTDIDFQKQVEEELKRANTDLTQFAYAASHDLQEPLRMISSYTQLLLRHYEGPASEEVATFIRYITDGISRMRELLADLLSYSEVGPKREITDESVDLNAVLQKVKENLAAAIEDSAAEVLSAPLPTVRGKEGHLVQLFQNLIANAIKYRGQSQPRITISVELGNNEWRFAVADNGIGIDPQYQEQVFGLFKRLHGKEIPGTGIGLAICQRVVERKGGRIWVESQGGQGSTFYFTLPAAKGAIHEAAIAGISNPARRG